MSREAIDPQYDLLGPENTETSGGIGTISLPRELILASAGSGKTFRISSRIIGLLAYGEPVESILASTFTRKAAGEILSRVMVRLAKAALDDRKAHELAEEIGGAEDDVVHLDSRRCLEILGRVVRHLHHLNIGTLDAFFIRTAQIFSAEIGLPPGWTIADEPTTARLRSEALQRILHDRRGAELTELVRLVNRGALPRSVHDGLLQRVGDLHSLLHQIDPEAEEPWAVYPGLTDESLPPEGVTRLAEAIELLPIPTTGAGSPRRNWSTALPRAATALREGDWEGFIENPITQRILDGRLHYDHETIEGELLRLFEEALEVACQIIGREIDAQARAMGSLVTLYDELINELQRREGAYRFEDITRHLGWPTPIAARPDLYYRLDAGLRHLLLDEFQDTSQSQWTALEPLADRILSGSGERAGSIVADPKQSIYGWRGASPDLVYEVGDRYELERDTLARSWRSSQVILDAVNSVFTGIDSNPVLGEDDRAIAADWARAFSHHEAVRNLPGYIRISVGPADETRANHRPNLLAYAAELAERLHHEAPGYTIGILTRENRAVARLIHELRTRGITASEEGGNPLTDSAPVIAILALFRLADHPDDTISRYHLAYSPLGEALGYTEYRDSVAADELSHQLRRELLDDGYGKVLSRIARLIMPSCDTRERRRLTQLVELAFRYEADAGLRPTDFVRIVETERIEDPMTATIRVMTIHQSKGLEFDIVILPELDTPIYPTGGATALPYREGGSGPITRVYPYLSTGIRPLFPEIEEAYQQSRAPILRDALSSLYVGMTRARYALYIPIRPDGKSGPGSAVTPARIVREALATGAPAVEGDELFYEAGNPGWALELETEGVRGAELEVDDEVPVTPLLRESPARRSRTLPRRRPSDLDDERELDLRELLRLRTSRSLEYGTLIHAWCQEIEWLDDGLPTDELLLTIAERQIPGISNTAELRSLCAEFKDWLAEPEIAAALSRGRYPEDAELEIEIPFAYRAGDTIVEGIIDRLITWEGGAEILDYKSDAVSKNDRVGLDQRTSFYQPQLIAYRDAVSTIYQINPEDVQANLIFLRAGVMREV